MYLTGLVHRDGLFEVASRWFADDLRPGDGRYVTEVFTYEKLISAPTSRHFLQDVLQGTSAGRTTTRRVHRKDELRHAIMESCPSPDERARVLFDRYRELPEEFFPRTPADLILTFGPTGSLLGMVRYKRIRRVAEKASRRIADQLAGTIRETALSLAVHPCTFTGGSHFEEESPLEPTAQDFAAAEWLVSHAFQDHKIVFKPGDLRIDDVVGYKFVGPPDELERIEAAIRNHPSASVVEREVHSGAYNDINLLLDLRLPPPAEIIDRMKGWDWSLATGRGLDAEHLARSFAPFVEQGARTFRAEVILTTFEELVESEFGRSIHEERILDQRSRAHYSGRIAKNASYLIGYLLMLAISPTIEVEHLPVKMWGRYLPDVFSASVWKLFGVEHGERLFDPLLVDPDHR
jgi:hypothetical protein